MSSPTSIDTDLYLALVIAGTSLVSVINRSFFFLSARELPMPPALQRGLRYAPLGALMAVVLPEVVLDGGALPATMLDARIVAALVTATYASWRRTDMLGTIVVGMATFLLLRD
ncbi:MAG: hypothetical protein RL385_734 [Pseudomonadota bacterium]|jgi:branched-subunit amino acid transport protein